MSLRLGDRNETVRRWRTVMAARFAGYARVRGELPTNTDEYGPRAAAWQTEYELRTGQEPDGVVSDADLRALGIPVPKDTRPWLFTVHGTGQPDPTGEGLPANAARLVLDLYKWQPIGNYPATAFPMWGSIMKGVDELVLQIEQKLTGNEDNFSMAGYSQGAMVVAYVLKHHILDPKGRLHKFLHRLRKVVFWGNPMRQKGIAHFDEWIHKIAPPESHGIYTEDLLENLEQYDFEVRDYAHRGDMYACNFDNDADEYKRAICKIVMRATDWISGPDSVVSQLKELALRPLPEMVATATAIIQAIKFGLSTEHGYNIYPAVAFLRDRP
ncbi:lysin B [Mycobacterium phage NothingSpecial]|nr:lysin B [Mycobacterium phage NothingSpecial]